MDLSRISTLLAAALLAYCSAALANAQHASGGPSTANPQAQPDPSRDNKLLVRAMRAADTWGHPDLQGEFAGMRAYAKGDYKAALTNFKYGARFADKPSQLALGIMYANGLGTARDPATGCAWLELAAERGYPRFVATRNQVCDALTPPERQQASTVLARLRPEYGDTVAKQRMATRLRIARSMRTGSRVGFDAGAQAFGSSNPNSGSLASLANTSPPNCGGTSITVDGIPWPTQGCVGRDFWAKDRWQPQTYFAARDAHYLGTVTVGPLQNVADPATPAPAGTSGN